MIFSFCLLIQFRYGGLDGIITTFGCVSGVAGANLSCGVALVLGYLLNIFSSRYFLSHLSLSFSFTLVYLVTIAYCTSFSHTGLPI